MPQPRIFSTCDLLIIDDLGTELYQFLYDLAVIFMLSTNAFCGRNPRSSPQTSGLNQLADIYSERVLSRIIQQLHI